MARRPQTRRSSVRGRELDDEEGRRYAGRSQAPNMAPVVGIIAIVAVCGVGFAVFANNNREPVKAEDTGAQTREVVDPFGDIAEETGPTGRSPGGKRSGLTNRSPADLLDDPVWRAAAARANEGYVMHQEAQKAKRAKEQSYFSKGVATREYFDALISETADWEMDLMSQYGDDDRRVRQIVNEREKWFTIMRKYHGLRDD